VGGRDFDMVEPVSCSLPPSQIYYNIFYRQIFPNELCTKKKQMETGNVELDPNSIRSMAKHARLERAEERRRQAHAADE
jgi:hypothetical protein